MNIMLRSLPVFTTVVVLGGLASAQEAAPPPPAGNTAISQPSAVEAGPPQESEKTVGVSQVRIVRLSQVKGQVRLDRRNDQKFEEAFANLPIVAGERLQTLVGLAEVEFEDNSSIRLTPNSLVEFPVLGRDPSGTTTTSISLVSGSMYVSRADGKGADGFTIHAGNETITLNPGGHLRLDLAAPAKLVVFKGTAMVSDASGTMMVGKKKAITFDPAAQAAPVFASSKAAATFDNWDKNSADYHQQVSAYTSVAGSPYAYGTNDLSYYGSFSNMGGCGSMWRPYLASASWNPYGSGVWSYYPGAGYSWVSPYPWGWTPYHSGSWQFCSTSGSWGWIPNGGWMGLNNMAALGSITRGRPVAPILPRAGEGTLVPVNLKELPVSHPDANNAFVFRNDSAGLGVPRGVFSDLGKVSHTVAQRGSASTAISDEQAQRGMIPMSRSSAEAPMGRGEVASSSHASSSFSGAGSGSSAGASHGGGGASSGGGHH